MTNTILRTGSSGPAVVELQNLLNSKLSLSPGLKTDGSLGNLTRQAVLRFQREKWLIVDGIVGNCTWNALRDTESYAILHSVMLIGQPTPTSCWFASASMILHRSITVPAFMLNASGALLNDSELNDARISSQFCRNFGLTFHDGRSWTADGLAGILRRGPAMCNVLWDVSGYVAGRGSNSHWVVFAGIRGNGNADATTLRVYDPLPVGRGSIYSVNYAKLMRNLPAATYQLFQR